jgi:hypothetical protein
MNILKLFPEKSESGANNIRGVQYFFVSVCDEVISPTRVRSIGPVQYYLCDGLQQISKAAVFVANGCCVCI